MNIADKAALYREIRRVLKPGAWLMLSELAQGKGAQVDYPTPWAAHAAASFLSSLEDTLRALESGGFEIVDQHDTLRKVLAYGARSRALVERGEKPPHRAVQLVHPDIAPQATANMGRGLADGRVVPIEVLCRKRG